MVSSKDTNTETEVALLGFRADVMQNDIQEIKSDVKETNAKVDGIIIKMESMKSYAAGAGAVASIAVTIVISVVIPLFKYVGSVAMAVIK